MGKWVAALAVMAGCAHQAGAPPRFEVLARDEASAQVGAVLAEHRADVVECFDEMADRREVTALLRVAVSVQVRGGAIAVAEVKPLDPSSITDGGLVACLADRLAAFPAGGADADLIVPLAVAPRISARSIAAVERAAATPSFVPQE